MQLKCGCIYDRGRWVKYCREHGLNLLRNRFKKANDDNLKRIADIKYGSDKESKPL